MTSKVKEWFEGSFKEWLNFYRLDLQVIESINDEFKFNIIWSGKNVTFSLTSEDLLELEEAITNDLSSEINKKYEHIFKISDLSYICLITSQKSTDISPCKISCFLDKESKKNIRMSISSEITMSILYQLVKHKYQVFFDAERFIKSAGGDFNEHLRVIYFNIEFNEKVSDDDSTILKIILSTIFEFNLALDREICPLGTINIPKEEIFMHEHFLSLHLNEIKEESNEVIQPIPHHLNIYDIEALSYYFAAKINEDIRLKYIDFYHVIEYFFERMVLKRISDQIKVSIKNPKIFYEDKEINKLSRKLKEEIIGDEKKNSFREKEILKKIIEECISENLEEEIMKERIIFNGISEDIPGISFNSKDKQKLILKLTDRIYGIRNAVLHSKEGSLTRIGPNSSYLEQFKGDIFILDKISIFLLRKFSETYN